MSNKLIEFVKSMFVTDGENDMNTATIVETNNGYGLFTRQGLVAEYTRERDAKRGATRRDLTLT